MTSFATAPIVLAISVGRGSGIVIRYVNCTTTKIMSQEVRNEETGHAALGSRKKADPKSELNIISNVNDVRGLKRSL